VELREQSFLIHGWDIAGLVSGPVQQSPILFLHGWLDNAASFRRLMSHLAEFHCVALDFPGHGLSQHHRDSFAYHFIDLVSFIDDVVDYFGKPLHIVSHSLGGAAATMFAAARPEKILSLTLIDTLGPLTESTENTVTRLREHLLARRSHRSVSRTFASIDEAVKYRVGASVVPTSQAAAEDIVTRGLRAVDGGFQWSHDPRLRWPSPNRLTEEQLDRVISQIQCPVLVIRADPGINLPAEKWQRRVGQVKNLEQSTIFGSHHIHIDESEQVAGRIRRFLCKLDE
jgi:pimeloyl-ACP methyl ester carboxylesterase